MTIFLKKKWFSTRYYYWQIRIEPGRESEWKIWSRDWTVGFPDLVVFFQLHDGQGNTRYGTMISLGAAYEEWGCASIAGDVPEVRVIPCDRVTVFGRFPFTPFTPSLKKSHLSRKELCSARLM